jgi:hypothetical protein
LGLGFISEGIIIPKEIEVFRNKDVIEIAGGEHHSIALIRNTNP